MLGLDMKTGSISHFFCENRVLLVVRISEGLLTNSMHVSMMPSERFVVRLSLIVTSGYLLIASQPSSGVRVHKRGEFHSLRWQMTSDFDWSTILCMHTSLE